MQYWVSCEDIRIFFVIFLRKYLGGGEKNFVTCKRQSIY